MSPLSHLDVPETAAAAPHGTAPNVTDQPPVSLWSLPWENAPLGAARVAAFWLDPASGTLHWDAPLPGFPIPSELPSLETRSPGGALRAPPALREERCARVVPEDPPALRAALQAAARAGVPCETRFCLEFPGETLPVWARCGLEPDGSVKGLLGPPLEPAPCPGEPPGPFLWEKRLRWAAESASVGVWDWTVATGDVVWDAEMFRIYGLPPTPGGRVAYSTWAERVHPEDLPREEAKLRELVVNLGRSEREFRIQRASDGAVRILKASEQAIPGPGGGTERVVGVNSDVTEERGRAEDIRRLNAQLQQRSAELETSLRELDAFAYSVSHDLRAPLRAVDGFSKILASEHGSQLDADGRRLLEIIMGEARRMGHLIDDLLEFSRMGRQKIVPIRIDMEQMARDVFAELLASHPESKIEFHLHPLPPAFGTAPMIRQVWANLLENAIKFTGHQPQARIEVRAESGPGGSVHTVTDNGAGFDMRHAHQLFHVFQRLHSQEEFPGSGVGLALVERIVSRHGGSVWASGSPGKGASFSFRLPQTGGEDAPARENGATVLPQPGASPPPQTDWPRCPSSGSGAARPEGIRRAAVAAQNRPMPHTAGKPSGPDPPQWERGACPLPEFCRAPPGDPC